MQGLLPPCCCPLPGHRHHSTDNKVTLVQMGSSGSSQRTSPKLPLAQCVPPTHITLQDSEERPPPPTHRTSRSAKRRKIDQNHDLRRPRSPPHRAPPTSPFRRGSGHPGGASLSGREVVKAPLALAAVVRLPMMFGERSCMRAPPGLAPTEPKLAPARGLPSTSHNASARRATIASWWNAVRVWRQGGG